MFEFYLISSYSKIYEKPTFISDRLTPITKNESKVADTLWRIQVSGGLHQNICLKLNNIH